MTPNFSAFPWERVPRMSRRAAQLQSIVARWIAAHEHAATRLEALVGAPIAATVAPGDEPAFDPHAACARVRSAGGVSIEVLGSSMGVRAIAQRLLGGPSELAAPRPLGVVEHSVWSLVVAAALEDLGVDGEVWPQLPLVPGVPSTSAASSMRVVLDVRAGELAMTVVVVAPAELALRVPPRDRSSARHATGRGGSRPSWLDRTRLDVPLVLGRCALHRDDLARVEVNDRITLEGVAGAASPSRSTASAGARPIELGFAGGGVGLAAAPGAVEAEVATGYVRRDMSLPDDAHVELTVGLGTTQLSLRQLAELSLGQIIPLGRPLAGPFEVRAAGRVLGRGELVDVDGELAVRIVSLGD